MKQREFPLQQGDLDCLCSIYAVLNLISLLKKHLSPNQAHEAFKHITAKIEHDPEGNLGELIRSGLDPEHLPWLFNEVSKVLNFCCEVECTDTELPKVDSEEPAIVYLQDSMNGLGFSHYTVLTKMDKTGIKLRDSYGFQELKQNSDLGTWSLSGNHRWQDWSEEGLELISVWQPRFCSKEN